MEGIKLHTIHLSCSLVSYIFLKDKTDTHNKDTTMTSLSGNTTVTGTNFMHSNMSFAIELSTCVPRLMSKDYQVIDIDTVNLYEMNFLRLLLETSK